MKRFLVCLVAIALATNAAYAGLVLSFTKVGTINTFDQYDIHITDFSSGDATNEAGNPAAYPTGPNSVSSLQGTLTATGGFMNFLGTTSTQIKNNSSNVLAGSGTGSYINFDAHSNTPTRVGASDSTTTAFTFSMNTTGGNFPNDALRLTPHDRNAADGFDQTLMASIFVKPGTTVSFLGQYNSSFQVNQPLSFNFTDPSVVGTDPIAVTSNPVSGTSRTVGETVALTNQAQGANPRDSAGVSTPVFTASAGTFSQTGANAIGSSATLAAGNTQTSTIAFSGGGLLNGLQVTGIMGFNVTSGVNGAGSGSGAYSFPLTATVSGNSGHQVAPVAAGGSYASLSGQSGLTGPQGANGNGLNSTATILAGTNNVGGATTVDMTWRARNPGEFRPGGTTPPLPAFASSLTSDVVNLTGMDGDTFVLSMSYDASLLQTSEDDDTRQGHLFLAYKDPSGNWVNAVLGNHPNAAANNPTGAPNFFNFNGSVAAGDGSYAAFVAANPGLALTDQLGAWGVNRGNDTVWAVLNHNSLFASVPEPSSMVLAGLGLIGLASYFRRRR